MTPLDPRLPIIAADAKVKTCHVHHCWHAMKAMGPSFHRDAFATFAGLERKHVDAIIDALGVHKAMPKTTARDRQEKATRLTRDFVIPFDWIEHAKAERGWTEGEAREEAQIFVNYWCARSDSGAAKLDWTATWHNWCRRSNRSGTFQPQKGDWDAEAKKAYQEKLARFDREGFSRSAKPIGQVLNFVVQERGAA